MKRWKAFILALALVLSGLPAEAQNQLPEAAPQAEQEEPAFSRVQVNVTVTDADGNPIPRLMVQAQAVGRSAIMSLTDNEGTCGFTLRDGSWTIKVIQQLEVLHRVEIEVGDRETIDMNINLGADDAPETDAPLTRPDISRNGGTTAEAEEINVGNLGENSAVAAAELSLFTDNVLIQARQKILDQYAANEYNINYWVDKNLQAGKSGNQRFRLDIDWEGNIVGVGGSNRSVNAYNSLLASKSAISDIPVNVNINVASDRANQYRGMYEFGAVEGQEAPASATGGNPLVATLRASRQFGNAITGGATAPENDLGFDLSNRSNLTEQSRTNFRSFYNEINNHIVDLYRPLKAAYNQATGVSEIAQGVELGVEKVFMQGITAKVIYNYNEAGGLSIRTVDLFFEDWQDFENFLEQGLRHDLSTTLEARFSNTGTRLRADYTVFINDVNDNNLNERVGALVSEHSRIDLSLNQKINLGILSNARISFSLAVNNLLNNTRNSVFLTSELESEFSQRKVLGGIRIEF